MILLRFLKSWRTVGASLGFVVVALSSLEVEARTSPPAEPSMAKAASYLGVLAGRDLSTEDVAWLKQRWREEFEVAPQVTAAEVDALAFAFESHQQDPDPLVLAQIRGKLLTDIYCSPGWAGDPNARRLKEILTPDENVLAADCLLGLIVLPFDIDGMIASHALLAGIAEQPHDAERDLVDALATVETDFAGGTPAEKAAMANGELRHAVLQRYWSRLDGDPKKKAFIDDVRGMDLGDFRAPARQFEGLALDDLGDIDYLAKAGDAKLTSYAIGEYREWLERIAGQGFDNREQGWLQQAIIDEFRVDPNKIIGEVASIEQMNDNYILAETDDQRQEMLDRWAAGLYCHGNGSDDPDERRLVEVIFRHDPVVEADCTAGRITRRQQEIVAEAGGAQLRERDLDLGFRFMHMILARPLLPDEKAFIPVLRSLCCCQLEGHTHLSVFTACGRIVTKRASAIEAPLG